MYKPGDIIKYLRPKQERSSEGYKDTDEVWVCLGIVDEYVEKKVLTKGGVVDKSYYSVSTLSGSSHTQEIEPKYVLCKLQEVKL